jgi:regulator of sigma E protease
MHLIDIPIVLFVLGVLVFVHELGHYLVAKWCGVRVETFSLGFGKRLFGFRRGDTDYRISLIPLGGYVKMSGENPMENRTGDTGEFTSHPRWQRFLIAIAGPAMNVIFTIVVLTSLFMFWNERPVYLDQPAIIGYVLDNSAAEKSGLQAGDRIARIQDINNPTWQQVIFKVILSPNQPLDISIQHGNDLVNKTIVPQAGSRDPLGDMGWLPLAKAIIKNPDPSMPAAKAGMKDGDEVVALNDVPLHSNSGLFLAVQKNKDNPLRVTVLRHQQEMKFALTPVAADDTQNPGRKIYRIGVSLPPETRPDPLPFGQAINKSFDEARANSMLIFDLFSKLFRGKVSIKVLESPVGIARDSGEAARSGGPSLLLLMAMLSLQLGIINLLPIPIMDGGLMAMLLIEGTMRRDINQQIKERMYQVAFVALILFFSVVIYNDVAKSFVHHAP